jgi:hypothetical protein
VAVAVLGRPAVCAQETNVGLPNVSRRWKTCDRVGISGRQVQMVQRRMIGMIGIK